MPLTPRWGLPYPQGSDAPDIPAHLEALAVSLDDVAKDDQGAVGSRPTSTPGSPGKKGRYYWATDERVLYRDNGAGWDRINKPVYVTSLPGSPVDGDEVFFEAATGVVWHLRYRAGASGSYKWEVVGGPPLLAEVVTEGGTANTSYSNLATVGPQVTPPLAGDYDVAIEAEYWNPDVGPCVMSYAIGAAAASDNDAFQVYSLGVSQVMMARRIRRKTALAAGAALTAKYRATAGVGGTATFRNRIISATPVRVG